MPERLHIPPRLRQLASLLVVCLLSLLAVATPLHATGLQEIRYWSLGEVTRVVVQFDGEFSYKWNRLEGPPRAFFDLPNVDLSMVRNARDRGRIRYIEVNDQILRQIRYAENSPGAARVVLDLNESCEISTSQLANPARLVIELRSRNGARPGVEVSRRGVVDQVSPAVNESIADNSNPPAVAVTAPASSEPSPRQTTEAAPLPVPPREITPAQVATIATNQTLANAATPTSAEAPASAQPIVTPRPQPDLSQAQASPATPVPAARSAVSGQPVEEAQSAVPETGPETALAKPATRTANGRQSLVRALGLKIGRVVIDPGHGGKDHGTTGVSGLKEKDLVLDVSKRLAELVRERLGSEVVLTREDDTFISLEERTEIANRNRADIFISVHANSSPYKLARGSETFFLNFTSSREAMDVAARENASSQRSVAELQDIVRKIALKDKRDESEDFAARIQTALYRAQRTAGMAQKNRGVKSAPFIVLVGAEMPSILVEIGFLSNAKEEAALKTPEYRQKIAEALLKGLETYMESLSHFEGSERTAMRE